MEPHPQFAEQATINALRTGDRARFIAALEQQLDTLDRFIERELRYQTALGNLHPDDVTPDEIVSEVVIRALRYFPRLPQRATLRGWLRLLALRAIDARLRQIRQRRRIEAVSIEAPIRSDQRADVYYQPDAALTWADVLPDPSPTPEETVLLQETRDALEEALNRLPPEQHLVFVLHAIEGLSYAEIAAITHRSRAAVKRLYHAARETLRQHFSGHFQTLEPAANASPSPNHLPTDTEA